METKKEIRTRILKLRDGISAGDRQEKSETIIGRLISTDDYIQAEKILVYVSYNSEVNTDNFINTCLSDGKQVFVPKVSGDEMVFIRISNLSELVTGYKGIREPDVSNDKLLYMINSMSGEIYNNANGSNNDLMVMPGSVFDRDRNRVGYGKGFYDRYLSSGFKGNTIALAYAVQIVRAGSFASLETDIKPLRIVTEHEWI